MPGQIRQLRLIQCAYLQPTSPLLLLTPQHMKEKLGVSRGTPAGLVKQSLNDTVLERVGVAKKQPRQCLCEPRSAPVSKDSSWRLHFDNTHLCTDHRSTTPISMWIINNARNTYLRPESSSTRGCHMWSRS